MSDLIERLRHQYCDGACETNRFEAADKLERLHRRLEWIRDEYAEQKAGVERIQLLLGWQEGDDE